MLRCGGPRREHAATEGRWLVQPAGQTTSFGQASTHPVFSSHCAPKIYGFESHISVPLVLADGSLFGSLCVLDPRPATLDAAVMAKVEALAAAIAAELRLEAAAA